MKKLSLKQERFCLEMVKPKATQYKAYLVAYNAAHMKRGTIDTEAWKLMQKPEITKRIQELMIKAQQKALLTREEWIRDAEKLYRADPRKLFDQFGNTVPIPELGDNEATLLEGFKFKEDFLGVKDKSGGKEQAVASGYTQDYKITSYKDRHAYMGKAMGWFNEEEQDGPQKIFIRRWVNVRIEGGQHERDTTRRAPRVVASGSGDDDGGVQSIDAGHDSGGREITTRTAATGCPDASMDAVEVAATADARSGAIVRRKITV